MRFTFGRKIEKLGRALKCKRCGSIDTVGCFFSITEKPDMIELGLKNEDVVWLCYPDCYPTRFKKEQGILIRKHLEDLSKSKNKSKDEKSITLSYEKNQDRNLKDKKSGKLSPIAKKMEERRQARLKERG